VQSDEFIAADAVELIGRRARVNLHELQQVLVTRVMAVLVVDAL
jgi:hypothetical protein